MQKINTILFCILFIFLSCKIYAQMANNIDNQRNKFNNYNAVFLKAGQPELEPGNKLKFKLKKSSHGEIYSGNLFKSMFVFLAYDSLGQERNWIVLYNWDKSLSMVGFSFDVQEKNMFGTTIEISIGETSQKTLPLQLRYIPDNKLLLYRWPNSSQPPVNFGEPSIEGIKEALPIGGLFPDLTLKTLDESTINFSELEGKIIVVNWWATSCLPCIAEMPGLNKLVDNYAEKEEIMFIAIAWNTEEELREFLEKKEFKYIQTMSNEHALKLFGKSFPRNVIINKKGRIVYNRSGAIATTYKKIEQSIQKLIALRK